MIAIEELIRVVVYLIVCGLILWLLIWLVDQTGLPEPLHKVARVLIIMIAVLIVISLLLSLIGRPVIRL